MHNHLQRAARYPVSWTLAGLGPAVALHPGMTVDEAEQRLIMLTLEHTHDNKTRAADILGISLKTLHNKLNRFRGRVPGKQPDDGGVPD